ncbi:alpha-1,2-fucosyltransferase [Ornithinimicrobium sediminis]|uniref:alpha-1,2-fucosyltransferase n=1 Tax=Ornithinimicrobium sediminis TaxID=2904603 RepID=UPI001E46621D|nr:alpha-1,2-fucosyltransferase [Ornithinimicrobium sediminis]
MPRHLLLPRPVGLALVGLERTGRLGLVGLRPVHEPAPAHPDSVRQDVLSGRTYVRGYFQSPSYFRGHEESVRARVTGLLTSMLTARGRELLDDLTEDSSSVAVHIRRGDYTTATNAQVHGVLSRHYYEEALELVQATGHHRRVWFSDDLVWVRENLARPGDLLCPPDVTTSAGGEIRLMAACSSRIIANSSFSWWGGWLGDPSTEEQPVVAPATWFASRPDDRATDLVPGSWQRL